MRRDHEHPIPKGNVKPAYLSDGAYVSNDGMSIWISADRDTQFHAVALDFDAITALARYAKQLGWEP